MMKALSFLGAAKYKLTTYVWQEGEKESSCETHLFPEAVARIFKPKQLIVFVTKEAKTHKPEDQAMSNFDELKQRLDKLMCPIDIPEGKSEDDLWEIFNTCVNVVDKGDEILLDVTHAFRSLPLIVFTVAACLRRVKEVTVRHIVYGAYEARDEQNRSPIFDLTPLLDLLDWLSGAEALLKRADAEALATQLRQTQARYWKEQQRDELPKMLQRLGNKLEGFSQALHLSRPCDVMQTAKDLLPLLEQSAEEVRRWAAPFGVIIEHVRTEVEGIAYDSPDRLDAENLRRQLALIDYYLQKGLVVQAVILAREWLVSFAMLKRGDGDWLDKKSREEVESDLNDVVFKQRDEIRELPEWLEQLPNCQAIAQVWDWLTQLRNDVAHCGMRTQPASAQNIHGRAKQIPERLKSLLNDLPAVALLGRRVVIDLKNLYGEVAKLDDLPTYLQKANALAGEGKEVILTGQAPVWLYLAVAHALHGKASKLLYSSPTTGEILIFDHSAR